MTSGYGAGLSRADLELAAAAAYDAFNAFCVNGALEDMRHSFHALELSLLFLEADPELAYDRRLTGRSRVGACLVELAMLADSTDGVDVALGLLNETSTHARERLGSAHPIFVATEANAASADVQLAWRRHSVSAMETAVGRLEVAAAGVSRCFGPEDHSTLSVQANLATAYEELHRLRSRAFSAILSNDEAVAEVWALVESAQAGDGAAFGLLYDRYINTVFRFIYFWADSRPLTEDLAADTFLRALKRIGSFTWQGRAFACWLITIARNLVADHFKHRRYRLEVTTGDSLDADRPNRRANVDAADHITNVTLVGAVRQLTHEQQECILLRFPSGFSVMETAQAMGKSEAAIKTLQYRAIGALSRTPPEGFESHRYRKIRSILRMRSSRADGRRSERLAVLLDESAGGRRRRRRSELDFELTPLVAIAADLSTIRIAPEPTDDFKAGLRALLMATVARDGMGVAVGEKEARAANRTVASARSEVVKQVPTPSIRRSRAAVLVGVAAGALVLSGVSVAGTYSLPGDPLYQVKRTSERAQLALTRSDTERGRLYLDFAASRLREASQVSPDWTGRVFSDMDDETVTGVNLLAGAAVAGDQNALNVIRAFMNAQRPQLDAFKEAVPSAGSFVRDSTQLLDRIAERVDAIENTITKGCGFPTVDELGPVPATC